MSRTLSKILVICAMAVIFPLMIIGTAFASFYSIDATTVVEVFVGEHEIPAEAYAQVKYKDQTSTKLTITEGHLNDIQIKTLSNGYDFVGWYEGTLENYKSGDAKEISTDERLNAKITDYSNLVAVFELKSYNVSWKYLSNPANSETFVETAPENAEDVYYWGDTLPVLENEHYDFKGWTVEGSTELIDIAKFDNSGEVKLIANASSFTEHGKVTINYYDEEEVLIDGASETIYKGTDYNVKAVSSVVSSLEAGYKYNWVDENDATPNGAINIAKDDARTSVNLYLTKNAITYTANVSVNSNATYSKSTEINFTAANKTALEELFNQSNWDMYSFYDLASITYNETEYTQSELANFVNTVVSANANNEATVEIEMNITKHFTNFIANAVEFIATNGRPVYDETLPATINGAVSIESSKTLADLLNTKEKYFTNSDDVEVKLSQVNVTVNGSAYEIINITEETTLNDLIEKILERVNVADAETLTITKLIARFAPVE